jgi:hypothetical protein
MVRIPAIFSRFEERAAARCPRPVPRLRRTIIKTPRKVNVAQQGNLRARE